MSADGLSGGDMIHFSEPVTHVCRQITHSGCRPRAKAPTFGHVAPMRSLNENFQSTSKPTIQLVMETHLFCSQLL